MIKPWKFIARKHIFQHPRLQLAEDTVALPNGKEISYLREAPAKTHSVAIIAINADGHILLQKEYSYPPNTVLWQLPGGAIESGESIIDAARRELAEESGFTANSCTVIGSYYLNNRRSDRKQFVIVCRICERKHFHQTMRNLSKAYGQTAQKSHAWLRQVKLRISHCLQRCSYMIRSIIPLYNLSISQFT